MAGLPASVWETADGVCGIISSGMWDSSDGPSISWGESRIAVGNAILAERKRCADVARATHELPDEEEEPGCDDWLQRTAANGRAERIAKAIEAGA